MAGRKKLKFSVWGGVGVFLVVLAIGGIVYFGVPQVFISSSSWTASTKVECDALLNQHRGDSCGVGCKTTCDGECVLHTFGTTGVEYKGTCVRSYDDSITKDLCALAGNGATSVGFKGYYSGYDVYGFSEDERVRVLKEGCGAGEVCLQVNTRSASCVPKGSECTPELLESCDGTVRVYTNSCTGASLRRADAVECGYSASASGSGEGDANAGAGGVGGSPECVYDSDCGSGMICFSGFCVVDALPGEPGSDSNQEVLCSAPVTVEDVCKCNPDKCEGVSSPISVAYWVLGGLALVAVAVVIYASRKKR